MLQNDRLFKFNPTGETLLSLIMFLCCIFINALANAFKGTPFFFLLYQGFLVLGLCIMFPVWYITQINQSLSSIGLTLVNWKKSLLFGLFFIMVSVPWRFVEKDFVLPKPGLFISMCIALVMASFFEEVFFRGFLQTRFERSFGIIPAIILSGLTFSLYHLGYPDYRNINLLIVLFFVGIFLAITFRTTNNILTSFMVNLPHAMITFIETKSFFNEKNAMISLITTLMALYFIYSYKRINA